MYDTLTSWFCHCDTIGRDTIKVPRAHLERAIREAAKQEGRDGEQYPWETGDEHRERTQQLSTGLST